MIQIDIKGPDDKGWTKAGELAFDSLPQFITSGPLMMLCAYICAYKSAELQKPLELKAYFVSDGNEKKASPGAVLIHIDNIGARSILGMASLRG